MPKRKRGYDLDRVEQKIRKLEKELRYGRKKSRRRHRSRHRSDRSESSRSWSSSRSRESRHSRHEREYRQPRDEHYEQQQGSENYEDLGWLFKDDEGTVEGDSLQEEISEEPTNPDPIPSTSCAENTVAVPSVVIVPQISPDHPPPSATQTATPLSIPTTDTLDSDLLDILGTDPTTNKKYGSAIQSDLSVRLQHWTTMGLTKKLRKELKEKYLTPDNCKLIDPPELNPEVKAAVSDTVIKRDKAIEGKQKELTLAITSLAEAITLLLSSKEKNTALLQLLMDSARIVCDCQHVDTVTRRNFLLNSVKKEFREQLQNTKIDKLLFGDNLADTLKVAKAINKSGSDLKPPAPKPPAKKQGPSTSTRNLNWRGQGPSRRVTMGPQRTREQAQPPPSMRARPRAYSGTSQPPPPAPRQNHNRR